MYVAFHMKYILTANSTVNMPVITVISWKPSQFDICQSLHTYIRFRPLISKVNIVCEEKRLLVSPRSSLSKYVQKVG